MCLQQYLTDKFSAWKPPAPEVVNRTKSDITLTWNQLEPFQFLIEHFLFRLEKNNKIPKWIVVYSGGKATKTIENLAPRHPHKFKIKVIIKKEAVIHISKKALKHFGSEEAIYEEFDKHNEKFHNNNENEGIQNVLKTATGDEERLEADKAGAYLQTHEKLKWLESQWSEETWTNTDTDGTSTVCFAMAIRCGYLKQVQSMLEERPDLINIVNSSNGFTPLATAVRQGDINTLRLLLLSGADVEQSSAAGQTALHLAVLSGNLEITELLVERGADVCARDWNGLRIEHYAVDSCSLGMVRFVFGRGGDITVVDNNGWTPLFRALCQGATTDIIEELVLRGSVLDIKDKAGLPLTSVAKILRNRHGRNRDSLLRLVDSNYPHEKALANFTRISKKVYTVHSMLKLV